jgi:hypothetical protein
VAIGSGVDRRRQELLAIQAGFTRPAVPLKDGGASVTVRPIAPGDIKALTEVMCGAFKGTPDERPRARVAKYLLDQLELNPEEVCLVALIKQDDAADAAAAEASAVKEEKVGEMNEGEEEEEEEEGQVPIAIVSLSFTQEARGGAAAAAAGAKAKTGAGSLPPPPDAAYLCNMAVTQPQRGGALQVESS